MLRLQDPGSGCLPCGRLLRQVLTSLLLAAPLLAGEVAATPSPAEAMAIPVRLGSLDAVRGALALTVPLGPQLPGRIPFGLTWTFNSLDGRDLRLGGAYRPVLWPTDPGVQVFPLGSTPPPEPTTTVRVGAANYTFHRHFNNAGVPTDAQFRALIASRHALGMEAGDSLSIISRQPSSDGTKWYLELQLILTIPSDLPGGKPTHELTAPMKIILDGPNAIWTTDGWNTFLTNQWGDTVYIEETGGVPGAPTRIRIKNSASPTEWVQLDLTLQTGALLGTNTTALTESPASLSVTNGMGLPEIQMTGFHRQDSVNYICPWKHSGFLPSSWTLGPSGGATVTSSMDWTRTCTLPEPPFHGPTVPYARLNRISHLNGNLVETFRYRGGVEIGAHAWDSSGVWVGNPYLEASDAQAVWAVETTGVGVASSVRIAKKLPTLDGVHETWVLKYPKATPGTGDPFRGLRIIHPSQAALLADPTGKPAFLYATCAVLGLERNHGIGAPADPTTPIPSTWAPTTCTVDQVVVKDGWDLSSWANPTGSLANAIPVTAVATRTRTYTANLPTRVIRIGATRDAWGPLQTDEYLRPPEPLPTLDGASLGAWAADLPSEAAGLKKTGTITRHWDPAALALLTDSDTKIRSVPSLPELQGLASVDFGTSAFTYVPGTALIQSVTNTRAGVTASETRTYKSGQPLLLTVSKSLNKGAPVEQGATYTYDSTPYQWPLSETDKVTGRTTTVDSRDALGRATLQTDWRGVQTRTEYDDWGRVAKVTRLAKGSIGPLITSYTYDPAGSWATETVTGEGSTLVTGKRFDALGRLTGITFPDLSTQTLEYDGWGQKVQESPVLGCNQTAYGMYTWTYSDKGQVTAAFDPKGRRLSSAYDPQAGPDSLWEPHWVDSEQAVVTKIWDDRAALPRQECHDLLGQKRKLIDSKNQTSLYSYDPDGHLKEASQGVQSRTYAYDPQTGWLTSRSEPEEGTTVYDDFTALGVPRHSRLVGRNQTHADTYLTLDDHQRPLSITTMLNGVTATARTFHYPDAVTPPDQMSESQPYGTLNESYGYDELKRLVARTITDGSQSFTTSQTLDTFGAQTSLVYPAGAGRLTQTVSSSTDSLHRPSTVWLDGQKRGEKDYGQANGSSWTSTLAYGNGATTTQITDRGELSRVTHTALDFAQINDMVWSPGGLLLQRGSDFFGYDELQRLNVATVAGLAPGESITQSFGYDRYGNRTTSQFTYTGANQPEEVMGWSNASYDPTTNQLPGTVPGAVGSLTTGAVYDDLGRLVSVLAVPNNQNKFSTGWGYDPSGRVIAESVDGQARTFLLDGEGLRFKAMKTDGSITYTIYGFSREPLAYFEKTPQVITHALKTANRKLAPMVGTPAAGAIIYSPASGTQVQTGTAILFNAGSARGTDYAWTFGDGTSASELSTTHAYAQAGTYTVTFKAMAEGCTTSKATVTVSVRAPAPVIGNFSASATTIPLGSGTTLTWSVSDATSLWVDNGVGTVAGSGSLVVYPSSSTTYTLTVANGTASAAQAVAVTVVQPPTINGFSASPSSIYQGDGSTLTWDVSGATSLSLDNGIGGVSNSSRGVSPSASTTYQLTATNTVNGVSISRTANASVTVNPRPTMPSIDAFYADAAAIAAGSGTTLRWSVSNGVGAVTVTISNIGTVATSGSQGIAPASTITYTLTATNTQDPGKWVSRDFTVSVVNRPVITFTVDNPVINYGSGTTLRWSISNTPTAANLDQGLGVVAASGSCPIAPGAGTRYTLTASNLAGQVSAFVDVAVTTAPVIQGFSSASTTLNQGASTTLSWTVQAASSISVTGTSVSYPATSVLVAPTKTTTYTLTASNSAGSDTRTVTVTVVIPATYQWKKSLIYGFGTLLAEERPDGTFYIMGDQVGSPNIITNASRAVVGRSKNLPFGERLLGSGTQSTRRYTNHEDQPGSAIYMQARTYLPAYGKFAQVDPAYDQAKDDPESWNLYNYVTNNPVTHTDPDGRMPTLFLGGTSITQGVWDGNDAFGTTQLENSYVFSPRKIERDSQGMDFQDIDVIFRGNYLGTSRVYESQAPLSNFTNQGAQTDPQNPGSKTSSDLYDVTHVSPDQPKGMSGNPANLDPLAVKWSEWEIAHNPGTGPGKNERSSFLIDPGTGKAVPGTAMEGDGTGVATRKSAPLLPAGATILGDIHHHWNGKPGATGYDGDMAWNVSMTNSGRTGSAFGHPVSGDYRSYVLTNTPSGYDLYRVQSIATGRTWRFQVDLIWSK